MIVCLMTTHYDISRAFKDHTSDFLSRTGQLEKRPREIALHVSSENLKQRQQNMRIFVLSSIKYCMTGCMEVCKKLEKKVGFA